jgi:ppGpp synthetase/RelA/SpoT-type nucleotidyltranferase
VFADGAVPALAVFSIVSYPVNISAAVSYTPDDIIETCEAGDMAEWVKREYTKGEIDRAGEMLIPWWTDPNAVLDHHLWKDGYHVLENWRTSHALPLNVLQAGLRGRVQRIEQNVIVAQRLKRFSSIMNKLVREPSMKLSQMHDLGGCRAILSSIRAVYGIYEMYCGHGSLLPNEGTPKPYDYIKSPKDDGYRGIHVVARYHARTPSRSPWNGQRIEIQLRTKLQHAFATAVETVTTFTRQPLKFGAGPTEWRRFFSLMGSALAIREQTQLVSGTPDKEEELIAELRGTAKELRVHQRLRGWTDALQTLPRKHIKDSKWLLLALDTTQNTIKVTGYKDRKEASREISEIEKSKRPDLDAVLVWVNSVKRLRTAYPNYYADTKEFLDALSTALASKQ